MAGAIPADAGEGRPDLSANAPADKVLDEAQDLGAPPYDVKNVELDHPGKECSFEAILKKHELAGSPPLALIGKIVNGADIDNTL
jgi:hypothetical protein